MPVTPLGFTDFRREMVFHQRWGEVDQLPQSRLDILKRLINRAVRKVFYALDPRRGPNQGLLYEWSWASPLRTLIVRPKVTGTLTAVPTRIGGETIGIDSLKPIFDSDLVGHILSFDSSGQQFTISEFVSSTRVNLVSALDPGAKDTVLGERRTEGTIGFTFERLATTVVETDNDRAFYDGMVLDRVEFATSGTQASIIGVDTSNKQLKIFGDVTGEEANNMTVVKPLSGAVITNNAAAGTGSIANLPQDTTRDDMADESDTVTIVDGNTYTITARTANADDTETLTTATIDTADLVRTKIEIKKLFTAANYSVVGTVGNESIVIVNPLNFFSPDDIGQRLAFLNQDLNTYEILSLVNPTVIDGKSVSNAALVAGDVTNEGIAVGFGVDVSIVRAGGEISLTSHDGNKTTLTATAAVFDATMVGLVCEFPLPIGGPSRKFVIASFTSTTVIVVNGDASGETGKFLIIGPSDLGATDAFTVGNTGSDYEMPIEYGGLDGPITFATPGWSNPVEITSERNIRVRRQQSDSSGRPQLANVRPRVHDGRFSGRYDLLLWPEEPDGKYTLEFPMLVILPELDEDNPFPPGGAAYGELYLSACLSEADSALDDKRGLPYTEYQEMLAAMISADGASTGAERLGKGFEDGSVLVRTTPQSTGVTYVTT